MCPVVIREGCLGEYWTWVRHEREWIKVRLKEKMGPRANWRDWPIGSIY